MRLPIVINLQPYLAPFTTCLLSSINEILAFDSGCLSLTNSFSEYITMWAH